MNPARRAILQAVEEEGGITVIPGRDIRGKKGEIGIPCVLIGWRLKWGGHVTCDVKPHVANPETGKWGYNSACFKLLQEN